MEDIPKNFNGRKMRLGPVNVKLSKSINTIPPPRINKKLTEFVCLLVAFNFLLNFVIEIVSLKIIHM